MKLLDALTRVMNDARPVAPVVTTKVLAALDRALAESPAKPVTVAPVPARPAAVVPVVVAAPADDHRPMRGAELRAAVAELGAAQPERAQWPERWWTDNDPDDGLRCRDMWAEALRICLIDICEQVCEDFAAQAFWDGTPEPLRHGRPRPLVRMHWIGTPDFMMVCALAGLDGDAVAGRVKRQMQTAQGAADLGRALSSAVRSSFGPMRTAFSAGAGHD